MVQQREVDPCGLPDGVSMQGLSPGDQADVVRRAMACRDLVHGRIEPAAYVEKVERVAVMAPIVWATTVRGFSSQYGEGDWSARQALGAPDATPDTDDAKAWASRGADDRTEYLEVGFERPTRIAAVDIRETFNPGAVSAIELVGASGKRVAIGTRRAFECTNEPIVAVRVTIDSVKVEGWNEIDAIGVQPCAE